MKLNLEDDLDVNDSKTLEINETAVAIMLLIIQSVARAPRTAPICDVIVDYGDARMSLDLATQGLLIALGLSIDNEMTLAFEEPVVS